MLRFSPTLDAALDASFYLRRLAEEHPDIAGQEHFSEADLQALTDEARCLGKAETGGINAAKIALRHQKNRFALMWSLAEIRDQLDFDTLGRLQSEFADATIQAALDAAWHSPEFGKMLPPRDRGDKTPADCGLFLLGLGKLGGYDLNFSSDVDLIAFYDKDAFPRPAMHAATYVITRLLNLTTQILSDKSPDFVWRVDWRLRPYASTRDLTMTTDTAIDFYYYRARPWHRLALIKARVIAGDEAAGRAFLEQLRPFLWRLDLDYRALDEIGEIKAKINREHPELRGQRAAGTSTDEVPLEVSDDFNLKLGFGGIREIEFIVNALQLVWGGRKPGLRTTHTLTALRELVRLSEIETDIGAALEAAYLTLRRAENRLQMLDNDQVYRVPKDRDAQKRYLRLLGVEREPFAEALQALRQTVYEQFVALFGGAITSAGEQVELEGLDEANQAIVETWYEGFIAYGALPDQARELKPLAGMLCRRLAEVGVEINHAVREVDGFFRRLPPGGQYLRLLQSQPALADAWLRPMLLSESMAVLIQQTPHLIDRFLEAPGPLDQLDAQLVFYTTDYETRLENLRRTANEELYLRYLKFLDQEISAAELEASLTRLAELLLDLCLQVTCDEMGIAEPPVAIIGFGKLGMRAMMPRSDLDLVYLFPDDGDLQLANQFAARFQTVVNAQMRQGRVYELDTRLRPSGKSGSPTISLESFKRHQIEKAQTWSHLALFPAHFTVGNPEAGDLFEEARRAILTRPRNHEAFLLDTWSMLARIRRQKTQALPPDWFAAKLREGGLMEAEYLLACMVIDAAPTQPELVEGGYSDTMTSIEASRPGFIKALHFLRRYQCEVRLFGWDDTPFAELPAPIQTHVLNALALESAPDLAAAVSQHTAVVQQEIDLFYSGLNHDQLADWKEESIVWQ